MNTRTAMRKTRQRRIRSVIRGTKTRPRLAVYRSHTALFVQLIDDTSGKTIAAKRSAGKNMEAAASLGKDIASLALKHTIQTVVFDRGGNRYHGAIRALADAAREGGLKF